MRQISGFINAWLLPTYLLQITIIDQITLTALLQYTKYVSQKLLIIRRYHIETNDDLAFVSNDD